MTPQITRVAISRQFLGKPPFYQVDYEANGARGFFEMRATDAFDAHKLAAQKLGLPSSAWFMR